MSERRLKGRYELRSVLARGEATTTHLALDHETGERCVVKVLSLASADALKAHELLMREARVLQRLEHPRIPRLVDFFSEEDGPDTRVCLVQQHVDGKSLFESVRAGQTLDEKQALALGVKLARVLEYLHGFEPPILHRDLKPSNVLVTQGDRVYLVDFGAVRDHLPLELLHPSGATVVGTRGYMPLEQFEGHAVPGSDVFALGATLVFALSGKEPGALGKQGMRLDFAPHVQVSPGLARLLARLLDPDWRERPLSATETRQELERLAEQSKRPAPVKRPGLWLGPVLPLLIAAAAIGIVLRSRTPPGEPRPQERGAAPVAQSESAPATSSGFWSRLFGGRTRKDAAGDPIPEHALRRFGTVRMRHGGPVRAVTFTPAGDRVVSASADGTVSLWSVANGEERRRIDVWEPATALALSPDGSRLLVGAERVSTARLAAIDGPEIARLLPIGAPNLPSVAVSEVAWSSDGSVVATRMHDAIDVWSGADGRHSRKLAVCAPGRGLSFVGSERTLLVACQQEVLLVDAATGMETRRVAIRGSHIPLKLSSDGRLLAQPSDNRIRLVDLSGSAPERSLFDSELQAASLTTFALSPDGRTAVGGLSNGRLVVWDLATGARLRVLEAHAGVVHAVAVSRDGKWLASGGDDSRVALFDLESGSERLAGAGHRGAVRGIDFVPGTGSLVSVADTTLRRWDRAGSATSLRSFDRPATAVFALSESRLAVVEEGRVHVQDVASGWEVTSAPLPAQRWRSRAAVAVPRGLLAAGGASALDVVDLSNGARRSFPVPRPEEPLAFSPDGLVVATLREEAERLEGRPLVLRDAATGSELATVPHNKGGPFPFACRSADGSYFGFVGGVWRLASDPKARLENIGWIGGARLCAVSPDARFVALARDQASGAIELRERVRASPTRWELRPIGELQGHRGPVTALVFAPDSRTLVSGGADTSIQFWDVAALKAPAEAPPRPQPRKSARLLLTFEDAIEGPGVAPVRARADAPLRFVPGRVGRALHPEAGLAFPETRGIVLGDEFTVSLFFRVAPGGVGPGVFQVLSSEAVSIDVRDGGKAYVFFHFRRGGHAQAELTPWIGTVQPDRWYHIGVSYRRDQAATRVCVDGVCGLGPGGPNFADRLGELTLSRPWNQPGVAAIDELAVFDRALTDDQIAVAAGLARAVPLPSPTPPPTPTPLPRLPAEQEPMPREGLPEGKDVAQHVSVEEKAGFTVYRFGGPLARAQALDLDSGLGAVWVGTSLGLVRHDPAAGSWRLWDETSGLPGARLNEIAVVAGRVFVDSSTPTTPGNVRGTGVLAFDVATRLWTPIGDLAGPWDLWGDGSTLWAGTGNGAEARDLETGAVRRFTRAAGELVHDAVHGVRRHGETVAFAAMGDYVKESKDFTGGGVTLWDRRRNQFRVYTLRDGLAHGYCSDVFPDDADVFVTHWEEKRGLSRIDRRAGRVEILRRSANGIDLGGVVLAGDDAELWIGQQGALVKLDRASRQATAWREADGLPGYIVSGIVVRDDAVWASVYAYGQDGVRAAGLVRFPRR